MRRAIHGSGRMLAQHAGWVGRGLRGAQTKLVVFYLCFLAVLGGFALGSLWQESDGGVYPERRRQPPPVTPPPAGHSWVEVKTTGYCPCRICCGKDSDGRTAINRKVTTYPYGIATEPKILPYGTRLFVPGYGEYMVDDTGGAMRQSARKGVVHLDLRFRDHKQARKWGVQWHWIAVPDELQAARPNSTWRLTAR